MEEGWEFTKKLLKKALKIIRRHLRTLLLILLPVILIIVLLSAAVYFVTVDDGTYKDDDWKSPAYGAAVYTSSTTISEDGKIKTEKTAKEIWDEMKKNNARTSLYLDDEKQLAKLMNAEVVTKYPDTRPNPDDPIDWSTVNLEDSNELQGIIKFRRQDKDENKSTLTYVDHETFYSWIEEYNNSGSESAKNNALSHFTIQQEEENVDGDIMISPDDVTTELSEAIVKAAKEEPASGAGYCQRWVYRVYKRAGIVENPSPSAYEAYKKYCQSTSKDNIPVGAAVYGTGRNSGGAGHVGIYVGNGMVMDNVGNINTSKLEDWILWQTDTIGGKKGWLGWGYAMSKVPEEYKKGTSSTSSSSSASTSDETKQNSEDGEDKDDDEKKPDKKLKSARTFVEVATWSQDDKKITSNDPNVEESSSTTYFMSTSQINYEEMTEKYVMPFEFLWSLLVVGEDKDFIMEIADLAYNSEIEITVYDNYTKNTDTTVTSYTREDENHVKAKVTASLDGTSKSGSTSFTDTRNNNYQVTEEIITQTDTVEAAVTKADTWIVNVTQEYTHEQPTSTTTTNSDTEKDESKPNSPTSKSNSYEHSKISQLEEDVKKQVKEATNSSGSPSVSKDIKVETYSRRTNIKKELTSVVEDTQYVSGTPNIEEKTDRNAEENGGKPNFVSIFNKSKYTANASNIRSAASWWFEILESNEATADMVDLCKYVLYKATGHDYGVKEFDFSMYDPNSFSDIGGIAGGTAEEKVWYALRSAGFSEYATAGAMGNIEGESSFNPKCVEGGYNENNGGIGLCQWTNSRRGTKGRNTQLKKYAKSKGTTWKDVDTQVEYLVTELTGKGAAKGYAGFIGRAGIYGCNMNGWKNATSVEKATEQFCGWFERPGKKYFYSSMPRRKKSAKKYYNQFHGRDLSSFSNVSGGSIIECAKKIHTYMEKNKYTYSLGGLSSSFAKSKSNKRVCCATYVSWVLQEAGYIQEREHSNSSSGLCKTLMKKGFTKITSRSKLKPGDVLYYSFGHTEIYAGNNKVYNAGATNIIRRSAPSGISGNPTYGLRANK